MSVDSLGHTQCRIRAPKVRFGRPGNSLSLKQSGPLILRCTQGALNLIAHVAQTVD